MHLYNNFSNIIIYSFVNMIKYKYDIKTYHIENLIRIKTHRYYNSRY